MEGHFVDAAYVNYDRYIVGKVVDGHSKVFLEGEGLGVAANMNAAHLVSNQKKTTPRKGGRSKPFYNKKHRA